MPVMTSQGAKSLTQVAIQNLGGLCTGLLSRVSSFLGDIPAKLPMHSFSTFMPSALCLELLTGLLHSGFYTP